MRNCRMEGAVARLGEIHLRAQDGVPKASRRPHLRERRSAESPRSSIANTQLLQILSHEADRCVDLLLRVRLR